MLEVGLYAGGVVQRLIVSEVCEGFGVFFELWQSQLQAMESGDESHT